MYAAYRALVNHALPLTNKRTYSTIRTLKKKVDIQIRCFCLREIRRIQIGMCLRLSKTKET